MKRVLIVLTVANFGLLVFLLAQMRPVRAQEVAPVLRARALEIVDEQGHVRAELRGFERDATLLRLSDQNGRVRVKLTAEPDGSGFTLFNDSQDPGISMGAKSTGSVIWWSDETRRAHVVKAN